MKVKKYKEKEKARAKAPKKGEIYKMRGQK